METAALCCGNARHTHAKKNQKKETLESLTLTAAQDLNVSSEAFGSPAFDSLQLPPPLPHCSFGVFHGSAPMQMLPWHPWVAVAHASPHKSEVATGLGNGKKISPCCLCLLNGNFFNQGLLRRSWNMFVFLGVELWSWSSGAAELSLSEGFLTHRAHDICHIML